MNIKEILELISETRSVLIEDYKFVHEKEPTHKELLTHIKTIIAEDRVDDILGEVLLEEDLLDTEEMYKLLLVTAAVFTKKS